MFISLKCFFLRDSSDANLSSLIKKLNCAAALLPIHSHFLQRTVFNGPGEPQIAWRIVFDTEADYEACLLESPWLDEVEPLLKTKSGARVDSIAYELGPFGNRGAVVTTGAWRALVMSVKEGVDRATRERFEADMLSMPKYVATIRNWSLSRVVASRGSRRWSYVWEQDFDDINAPFGEYRAHPLHWGVIDRWYDIENPQHIMDGRLLKTICHAASSVIAPERR